MKMRCNQVISNTGFKSPCSIKGESCRFSPLETPSALCPPQEAGFTLNLKMQPGFTLIELTIAMTLMALIAMILYGGFYLSNRALRDTHTVRDIHI